MEVASPFASPGNDQKDQAEDQHSESGACEPLKNNPCDDTQKAGESQDPANPCAGESEGPKNPSAGDSEEPVNPINELHDTEAADLFLEVLGFGRHDPVILSAGGDNYWRIPRKPQGGYDWKQVAAHAAHGRDWPGFLR